MNTSIGQETVELTTRVFIDGIETKLCRGRIGLFIARSKATIIDDLFLSLLYLLVQLKMIFLDEIRTPRT